MTVTFAGTGITISGNTTNAGTDLRLLVPEPQTAQADEHPCELYKTHSPVVCRTQGHHIYPVYLQNRVYGKITIPTLMWLCGGCHDSTHTWLDWLLGEARKPSVLPSLRARKLAQSTYDWFTAAMAAKL